MAGASSGLQESFVHRHTAFTHGNMFTVVTCEHLMVFFIKGESEGRAGSGRCIGRLGQLCLSARTGFF